MIVFTRRKGESIKIGDDIEVSVNDICRDTVYLSIDCPRSVSVHRKETYEAIQRAKAEGVNPCA